MTNTVKGWMVLDDYVASLGGRLAHAHGEVVVWVGEKHEHVTDEALEMDDAKLPRDRTKGITSGLC